MSTPSHSVQHCTTMTEVRAHIDALDAQIVPLLAQRCGYVAQAGRIKQAEHQIVDVDRIEFIVARVCAQADSLGAPAAVVEAAYRALIQASIDFERGEFARLHRPVLTGEQA
ncbi:chorismate mutase [Hydrogenophaga soli]|nr:chorismate mutase [Burkholderiaceae bacterium]